MTTLGEAARTRGRLVGHSGFGEHQGFGRSDVTLRDDKSFIDFVTNSGTSLFGTARLLCSSRDDAEDLLQTALEKAYRHWPKLTPGRDPEPYVRKILVNTAINRGRRRRILREINMASPPETAAPSSHSSFELRDELIQGLQHLGPRQRAVLVLRYWEDLPESEIAAILNCSVGTVKSQAARGLAQLRSRMDDAAHKTSARR